MKNFFSGGNECLSNSRLHGYYRIVEGADFLQLAIGKEIIYKRHFYSDFLQFLVQKCNKTKNS